MEMHRCLTFMGTNQHATLRTVSRICRITLSAVSEMGTPPNTSAGASGACPAPRDFTRQPDEYTQVFKSCQSAALAPWYLPCWDGECILRALTSAHAEHVTGDVHGLVVVLVVRAALLGEDAVHHSPPHGVVLRRGGGPRGVVHTALHARSLKEGGPTMRYRS